MVQRFKFQRDMVSGQALGDALLRAVLKPGIQLPDLMVVVPLHHRRECSRGFNQAFVLARVIQKSTGIPVRGGLLRRVRHTAAQAGLDARARRRNIRGALQCRAAHELNGNVHIAVVDDVMTTGATMRECARVLKRAGAGTVSAWVAARTLKAQIN